VLSTFATTTVNQLFNGLSNSLTEASSTGTGYGNKTFPGAGSEPPADYSGGNAYTLGSNGGDVVFSIQPANQGPQAFGLAKNAYLPTAITSIPVKEFTKVPFNVNNYTGDLLRGQSMLNNVAKTQTTFTAAGPFADSTLNFSAL
jgi:hypothetical protein